MLLALTGEVSVQAAAERYGLSATTVYNAIARERERQRDANPEDELTC
jgi:transposase-like protein